MAEDIDPELSKLGEEIRLRHMNTRMAIARQKAAVSWLLDKIKAEGRPTNMTYGHKTVYPEDLHKGRRGVMEPVVGQMFSYYYDPKTKDDLPYYDRFPLVFIMKMQEDGFDGLNLHYLPPYLRARLLGYVRATMLSRKLSREARIKLTWQMIKTFSQYKIAAPCYKRYLSSHVQSKIVRIHPQDWHHVVMLPVDKFVKASRNQVWQDSLKIIRSF